jgi:hypothetical protein
MAVLETAEVAGSLDRAALLVAQAEIEEDLDRFAQARRTIGTAIRLLECCSVSERHHEDRVLLWCQAQERLAGLDRLAGRFAAASARLGVVVKRVAATWGETSRAVVTAANALGVVYKYAANFDAPQAAYHRAVRALDGGADPDPLLRAGLLHNLGAWPTPGATSKSESPSPRMAWRSAWRFWARDTPTWRETSTLWAPSISWPGG